MDFLIHWPPGQWLPQSNVKACEDIWRETNIEPVTTFLKKTRLRWYGHEGDDTKLQEDAKYADAGKEKRRGPRKAWMDNNKEDTCGRTQDDGINGMKSKCMAREDKYRSLTRQMRAIGDVRKTLLFSVIVYTR